MILVDTGFLLALLDTRDALHERARAWALHLQEQSFRCRFADAREPV